MHRKFGNKQSYSNTKVKNKRKKMWTMENKIKRFNSRKIGQKKLLSDGLTLPKVIQTSAGLLLDKEECSLPVKDYRKKDHSKMTYDNRFLRKSDKRKKAPKYKRNILNQIRKRRMKDLRINLNEKHGKFMLGGRVIFESFKRRKEEKLTIQEKQTQYMRDKMKTLRHKKIASTKKKIDENNNKANQPKHLIKTVVPQKDGNTILTPDERFIPSLSEYQLKDRLGKGAYAKVNLIRHKITHRTYALKTYPKSYFCKPHRITNIRNEVKLLFLCKHPNIIKLHNVCETKDNIHLLMERGGNISLDKYLGNIQNHKVSNREAARIIQQVAIALDYLHSNGIAHRDIKLGNILIGNKGRVWLIDFGFATVITDKKITNYCGTPCYMCPEILRKEPYGGQNADIWALGVVLFRLIFGKVPFRGKGKELKKSIILGNFNVPQSTSYSLENLLREMMNMDPRERASAKAVLNSPWLCNAI